MFARKLIRPSTLFSEKDIFGELHAIEKLYKPDHGHDGLESPDNENSATVPRAVRFESCAHQNLVRIFASGRMPLSPDYYIDMELCQYDLNQWIVKNQVLTKNWERETETEGDHNIIISDIFDMLDEGLNIVLQILTGLEFIHSHGMVHRDLNPRNGKSLQVLPAN